MALYKAVMNINEDGRRPHGWHGLDGDWCIKRDTPTVFTFLFLLLPPVLFGVNEPERHIHTKKVTMNVKKNKETENFMKRINYKHFTRCEWALILWSVNYLLWIKKIVGISRYKKKFFVWMTFDHLCILNFSWFCNKVTETLMKKKLCVHLLRSCRQWRIYIVTFWTRPPPPGPNSFTLMQFLGNFGKIVCWRPPWELAPPPRGNPGSAIVHIFELFKYKCKLSPDYEWEYN